MIMSKSNIVPFPRRPSGFALGKADVQSLVAPIGWVSADLIRRFLENSRLIPPTATNPAKVRVTITSGDQRISIGG